MKQTLMLLTDGITEATDGSHEDLLFASHRALEYVRAHQAESARDLADGICEAARTFSTGRIQLEDLTNVVLKVV